VAEHFHLFSLDLSGDSEEEETLILNVTDMEYSSKKTEGKRTSGKSIRSWYPMKQWWKWICIVKVQYGLVLQRGYVFECFVL